MVRSMPQNGQNVIARPCGNLLSQYRQHRCATAGAAADEDGVGRCDGGGNRSCSLDTAEGTAAPLACARRRVLVAHARTMDSVGDGNASAERQAP